MTFNQKLAAYERQTENERSREAEDDDRRQEGEDVELDNVHPVFQEIFKMHLKRGDINFNKVLK